jgi:hypothetical protein
MKFRKRPVVIEAEQLTWPNWERICDFVPKPWFVRGCFVKPDGTPYPDDKSGERMGLILRTLESQEFVAQQDDWIIRGVAGEFYACKPDVFERTYERADAEVDNPPHL